MPRCRLSSLRLLHLPQVVTLAHVLVATLQGAASYGRLSAAGMAAAAGGTDGERVLAREAAAQGMSVDQYRAHQEDLALQEAIQVCLGDD